MTAPTPAPDLALGWSGGKDSALALWTLRRERGEDPGALVTTVTEGYDRVSMHGVRRDLLRAQAAAVGVPLAEVAIPPECPNALYEERMEAALRSPALAGARRMAFGDLFLADVRAYREERLARAGREAEFPLWGRDTRKLARSFVTAGFQATLVCVDPAQLDGAFAGREFDDELLDGLPAGVDPCGENGEFHTFVHDGPVFRRPVACRAGEVVERGGFVFCDLLPGPVAG